MDSLFETYIEYIPKLVEILKKEFPEEKVSVLEKKAFDVLRGFLPMSTLSQVALHGNAQSFKYLIDRCINHPLGELRWFAQAARKALDNEIPALLLRLDDNVTKDYQIELQARRKRMREKVNQEFKEKESSFSNPEVRLIDYDKEGEDKVIAGLLFEQGDSRLSWNTIFNKVKLWPDEKKEEVLKTHFEGRNARWQKVGRAFENAFVRFEIIMNAGAYRDTHRHRMHTQERQRFTTHLGYETISDIEKYAITGILKQRMEESKEIFEKIEEKDADIAQYAVTMFHFMRFYQHQNLRQFFWEVELRTGPQGRPDYRWIEQEKFRLLQNVYPLIMKYVLVDMNSYDLARRGTEEKIKEKEKYLAEHLK